MKDFWLEDEDKTNVLEPIREKDIVQAEKMLGVTLPKTYKKLIKKQNGGYIQRTIFPINFSTSSVGEYMEIRSIYGIGEEGILSSAYLIEEWGLPNNIILLDGDGHSWVAMDYRGKTSDPSIVYIDVDEEVEDQIANSFEEFIDGLQEEDISMEFDSEDDFPNLDNISKIEAEQIFQTSDDEILIRSVIINIPLEEADLNWMLDQLMFLLDKHNTEGIAEQAADFFLMHSHLEEKMDASKHIKLMNILHSLPYPRVKEILDMIGKIERI